MIYEPIEVFDWREALTGSLQQVGIVAAADFVMGSNKPWEYYTGLAFGFAAGATSIPGAAATLYAIGDTVETLFFKSPDSSSVRIFLNGIATATVDGYAGAAVWEALTVTGLVPGEVNRIDFVNVHNTNPSASGMDWMALASITVTGPGAWAEPRSFSMATFNISYSLQDADGNVNSFAVKVPAGSLTLAEIEGFAQQLAPIVDDVTDAQIVDMAIGLNAALPGGLKSSPVANSNNQEGGLISFNTDGPYKYSYRVPAWYQAGFSGAEINQSETNAAAFITAMLSGLDVSGTQVIPSDAYENDLTSVARAYKSFRK